MYILHSDFLKRWKFCFKAKLKVLTDSLEFRLFPRLTANRAVKWCRKHPHPWELGFSVEVDPRLPYFPSRLSSSMSVFISVSIVFSIPVICYVWSSLLMFSDVFFLTYLIDYFFHSHCFYLVLLQCFNFLDDFFLLHF